MHFGRSTYILKTREFLSPGVELNVGVEAYTRDQPLDTESNSSSTPRKDIDFIRPCQHHLFDKITRNLYSLSLFYRMWHSWDDLTSEMVGLKLNNINGQKRKCSVIRAPEGVYPLQGSLR